MKVIIESLLSPWYNRNRWLGVQKPSSFSTCVLFFLFFLLRSFSSFSSCVLFFLLRSFSSCALFFLLRSFSSCVLFFLLRSFSSCVPFPLAGREGVNQRRCCDVKLSLRAQIRSLTRTGIYRLPTCIHYSCWSRVLSGHLPFPRGKKKKKPRETRSSHAHAGHVRACVLGRGVRRKPCTYVRARAWGA